jgi:AraC-like DNA-binding protein/quercetin dioxygenase-like cupin family protein
VRPRKLQVDDAAAAPVVAAGDEKRDVSGIAADFAHGHVLARHRHRRAQLVYAIEGVMTVQTSSGLWVVPPLRALWVPPGVVHSIRMTGSVRMRTLYFTARVLPSAAPKRCGVLRVSPLLREIATRIAETDAALDEQRQRRLVAVLFDELSAAGVSALELPMPSDARLRKICDALVADPADSRESAAWARVAAVSERSLARLFPQQTGMTLMRWRQQLRLLRGLERLGAGDSVTTVAVHLGYASTSAFIQVFR